MGLGLHIVAAAVIIIGVLRMTPIRTIFLKLIALGSTLIKQVKLGTKINTIKNMFNFNMAYRLMGLHNKWKCPVTKVLMMIRGFEKFCSPCHVKVICSHCLSNEEVIDMKSAAFCYDSLITIDNWLVSILPSLNPTILISGFLDSWNYSYQFGETKTVVGDSSNPTKFFCIHTILHGMDISGLTIEIVLNLELAYNNKKTRLTLTTRFINYLPRCSYHLL